MRHNPKFHRGDRVVLAEGPRKYTRGTFLSLRDYVERGILENRAVH
jgi:hypothetical protein